MSAPPVSHDQVHRDLDVHYFSDYALFTGAVRQYVAKTLFEAFKADPNDWHRRLVIVGLYKEEFAAYEDLGAILESIIRWRRKEIKVPFEGMLRYKDDKVALPALFARRNIRSSLDLATALEVENLVPPDWPNVVPDIDCAAGLRAITKFIVEDCLNNQKSHGVEAYNRIKHGLILFPNGQRYLSTSPNAPAVLLNTKSPKSANPYTMMAMPMTDDLIERRSLLIEFIQASLRAIAALYVMTQYPGYLSERFHLPSDSHFFLSPNLSDVRSFFWQLEQKHRESAL